MNAWKDKVAAKGLIPGPSGDPRRIFGQHLTTTPLDLDSDGEEIEPTPPRKRQKGVWYAPWYEEEKKMSKEEKERAALHSYNLVISQLTDPKYVWDVRKKSGRKSRDNFSEYMLTLGVGVWQSRKMAEDEGDIFGVPMNSRRDARGAGSGGGVGENPEFSNLNIMPGGVIPPPATSANSLYPSRGRVVRSKRGGRG